MQKRVLVGLALMAALGPAALAAGNPADYNGDGRISREEFRNQTARIAFEADKNANGAIDDDEFKLGGDQRKAFDANGDGRVSVEEFQAGHMSGFDEADKNADGFLGANEMKGGN